MHTTQIEKIEKQISPIIKNNLIYSLKDCIKAQVHDGVFSHETISYNVCAFSSQHLLPELRNICKSNHLESSEKHHLSYIDVLTVTAKHADNIEKHHEELVISDFALEGIVMQVLLAACALLSDIIADHISDKIFLALTAEPIHSKSSDLDFCINLVKNTIEQDLKLQEVLHETL
ncbi:hypothetical protein [Photobacterium kishitanii]|uniref:Uncharacterized protein n=1 Tax=Photobacterium kishitanii TaxID=318456 RepID=A0A2T3KLL2_9GAMM|nr:hypothetical protein [Photobacterium kishitanii]PSV00592.1 hypothetical protein C9J27_05505 [Photobacterium kishitanii]